MNVGPMLAHAGQRTENASIDTRSQARYSREQPRPDAAQAGRMSARFNRNGPGDMHVAKRMPVRALSLQRMSAGEIAVILHLFDAAFNDIRANPGDVSVQRTLPVAFKPASFTRQSTTRRSHATSNR
ncbi:hypothetical protein [Burkholderia semiarida]|uniref:hypothetical protein n=1 Tax=Burkholderia semiarida TaxID=2843303 RepID=UPI0038779377